MAFELLSSLLAIDLKDRLLVYCPDVTFKEWGYLDDDRLVLIDSDRFSLIPERALYDLGEYGDRSRRIGVAPKSELESPPAWIVEVDLVHSIGGYIAEELRNYPAVLTLHDLQHVHYPENFDSAEVGARNSNYLASFESASAVICVSESVKTDLLENFDIDSEKVVSIWNIPSGSSLGELDASTSKGVHRKLLGDSDYILFPSHAWPHKNHLRLLEAFSIVSKRRANLKLVFTGGRFDEGHPVASRIRDLELENRVTHLGYRTPFELRCLLRNATALVYPSIFEGFGMPVAEAFLAGTPVVCSDITPLREIGGDAILAFDPYDSSDIAEKILQLLEDQALREDLIEKGRERSQLFDPRKVAQKTHDIYRRVGGLEPVELTFVGEKQNLRWELSQHWGLLFQERWERSEWLSGIQAWIATLWYSPGRAWGLLRNQRRKSRPIDRDEFKRYGDGWIGPRFEDWLMVPKQAKRLEIQFEGPPDSFRKGSNLCVFFEEAKIFEGSFQDRDSIGVSIEIPKDCPDIVKISATCDRYFVPAEEGLSEDGRQLSAKLIGIRWIR